MNQIFLHEDMLESLGYYGSQNMFPLYYSQANASNWTNAVLNIWPEIERDYGKTNVTIVIYCEHNKDFHSITVNGDEI